MLKDLKQAIEKELLLFFMNKKKEASFEMWQKIKSFTLQGGKRIRPQLMYHGYLAAGGRRRAQILKASCSLELIHSSLLIHDDVIDKDKKRRGGDTVWYKYAKASNDEHYGYSQAIVAGDLAGAWAFECLLEADFPNDLKFKAIRQFVRMLNEVNFGQALDIKFQQAGRVKVKDVLKVLEYKTAKYTIESPLLLGAILAGASSSFLRKLSAYAIPVGIAFQIKDDILGVFGNEKITGKPVGADLREGKKTLLVIKALERAKGDDRKFLLKSLASNVLRTKDIERARDIIKKTGSLQYSESLANKLIVKGKASLNNLSLPRQVKDYLADLADFIVSRGY